VSASDSKLDFHAKSSLHPVHGSASNVSGYVDADFAGDALATNPAPKMHVEFAVEHLRSGNVMQDREMWKLIDSRRFPTVAADLRSLERDGADGRYKASGDITLAGRQRRYEGTLTLERDGANLQLEGELRVDIRDFGLQPPRFLMLKVEPVVNVRLRLVAAAKE
jgi:polyisoprenoid-binding protein YceI